MKDTTLRWKIGTMTTTDMSQKLIKEIGAFDDGMLQAALVT